MIEIPSWLWLTLLYGSVIFILIQLYLWLTKNARAKKKRGWNNPLNYTNWVSFVLLDGRRIVSLEKGEQLEEILEDMTVKIGGQYFYKLVYPNSSTKLKSWAPENEEGTPYLQMLLPYDEVAHVWMQREYKERR